MASTTRGRVLRTGPTETGSPPVAIEPDVPGAASGIGGTPDPSSLTWPRRSGRPATVRTSTDAVPSAAAREKDAATLFDEANTARRRGNHADAAAAYRRLIESYPRSSEAHESLVTLGRMRLEDGDAANALPSFDAYVSRGGPLAAEAMLGRALALEQLGRADDERGAWSALIDAYPDSVHARRARARLAELGR
jgi:TolA-binding protein